jgi:hypothetical protein
VIGKPAVFRSVFFCEQKHKGVGVHSFRLSMLFLKKQTTQRERKLAAVLEGLGRHCSRSVLVFLHAKSNEDDYRVACLGSGFNALLSL